MTLLCSSCGKDIDPTSAWHMVHDEIPPAPEFPTGYGFESPLCAECYKEYVDMEENREVGVDRKDGTDLLLEALYGVSSAQTIGKAIGGSNAPMLRDAAQEILHLRQENADIRKRLEELLANRGIV